MAQPLAMTMINKTLSRRLERLEAEIVLVEEQVVVIHIHGVTREGQVVSSLEFTVHIPPGPMKRRPR